MPKLRLLLIFPEYPDAIFNPKKHLSPIKISDSVKIGHRSDAAKQNHTVADADCQQTSTHHYRANRMTYHGALFENNFPRTD